MGKLPEKIQSELETWMDKQEQLQKQEVVSKKMEDSQLSQEVVSLDQGIAKKKVEVVSKTVKK